MFKDVHCAYMRSLCESIGGRNPAWWRLSGCVNGDSELFEKALKFVESSPLWTLDDMAQYLAMFGTVPPDAMANMPPHIAHAMHRLERFYYPINTLSFADLLLGTPIERAFDNPVLKAVDWVRGWCASRRGDN